MSLNFSVKNIKDYDEHFTYKNDTQWHPLTETIAFISIPLMMNEITEKNYKEWYKRAHIWEHCIGAMRKRENGEEVYLTLKEVKSHIGFSVNVGPESFTAFKNNTWKRLVEKANYALENANG